MLCRGYSSDLELAQAIVWQRALGTQGDMGRFRGTHNTVFLRQRLPVDFPVFNVQVPPHENQSHRLNATLRAMVEIAGDQPARATNNKAVVRKST
jgi:hypothetical protein